jgi:hypothetical protein
MIRNSEIDINHETTGDGDPRLYRKTIDKNIRLLVSTLSMLPEIYPFESCGGHKKPGKRLNPEREGSFRVEFITHLDVPEDRIRRSISVIQNITFVYGGKLILIKDDFPAKNNERCWQLAGEDINPDLVAKRIYSLAKENGLIKKD